MWACWTRSWRKIVRCGVLAVLTAATANTRLAESADSRSVAMKPVVLGDDAFQVADGWTLERVATEPLVRYPVCGDFAPDGRLFIAESSGSSAPVQEQLQQRPHRLVTLEDTDGDGHFDRRTVFAEGLMLPQGVLYWRDRVLVSTPPQIWEFRDTDADGVADERSIWFDGKTLTGCANDLHGPYRGRDGAVYWCKGAFAEQQYARPDGSVWSTRASHVFRRHPQTGSVESVMTGGMDNPVEFASTMCGERFFTCTFIQQPAEGLRDALVHAVYGGVYGKIHGALVGHLRTGPLMPVLAHLGPAAPAGLMLRESVLSDSDLLGELLVAQFNLQKISRHRLVPAGSAFRTEDSDLLVAERPDFHPTDVLEDADGSLLVIDTGGWYTLCCPTSHVDQSRAGGGIYRLRQTGHRFSPDPRGEQLGWTTLTTDQLVQLLGDPRPAVRERVRQRLLLSASWETLNSLRNGLRGGRGSALARTEAVWSLVQWIGSVTSPELAEQGLELLVEALEDPHPTVQLAAAQGVGLYRCTGAAASLHRWLALGTPRQARAAAEALGRIGRSDAVPALLTATTRSDLDRPLEHALRYALLEIGSSPEAAAATDLVANDLESAEPGRRMTAMQVLDQLDSSSLQASHVLTALQSPVAGEREIAAEVLGRREEWDAVLAEELPQLLESGLAAADRKGWLETLQRLLVRPSLAGAVGHLIANGSPEVREEILSTLETAPPAKLPVVWAAPLAERLMDPTSGSDEPTRIASLVAAVRWESPPPEVLVAALQEAMRRHSDDPRMWLTMAAAAPDGMRLAGLKLDDGSGASHTAAINRLVNSIGPEHSPRDRALALAALQRQPLEPAVAGRLAEVANRLGPMELRGVLGLLREEHDAEVNRQLLVSLAANPGVRDLPIQEIEDHFAEHPAAIRYQATAWIEQLDGDQRSRQATRLASLLAELPPGDPLRGIQVFRSKRAACSACHAIGYHGGRIGPDLTRIHRIRTRQDLLEAILFPSASFVRSYEAIQVLTQDGRVYNGLLAAEDLESLTLVMGIDQRVRVLREEIETVQPSSLSIMPAGLDQQLSSQELADLLALLQSER